MPRFMAIIVDSADSGDPTPEEWQSVMDQYNAFGAEASAAGVVGGGEALQPPSTAVTIKVEGGKGGSLSRSDGPFAEAKEVIGGFYLLDCKDMDEAVEWAAKIPGAWYGRIEVRPCIDFG